MKITVAICTWNRAGLLDQTLAEIRKLRIPAEVEWELLVVDNNSTDDTAAVIRRHMNHLPLRSLLEKKQGLSHARNCAVAAATGELLIWTDDDVIVDAEWLVAYATAAVQWPDAAFFGGTIEPWFEVTPPRWIQQHFQQLTPCYAICNFGSAVRKLDGELPFGANMAFRRSVYSNFRFNGQLGHSKNNLVGGEETELFDRLNSAGHSGVWVGNASVRHQIPRSRLTERFILDWHIGYGRMLFRCQENATEPQLWRAPRWAIRKYLESRALVTALRPFRSQAWLNALKVMGKCRGIILESRSSPKTNSA